MLIAELELPWLFNSIRCMVRKTTRNYLDETLFAHFCLNCHQVFLARFSWVNAGMAERWQGEYYSCPVCGEAAADEWDTKRHYRSTVGKVDRLGIPVPRSMLIRLHEFKKHLRLTVDAPCIAFDEQYPENVNYHRVVETYTFDIENQRTYFRQTGFPGAQEETTEISLPYDHTLVSRSVLRFLRRNSRAWRERKPQVTEFLKKLRETVCRKLYEVKGFRMKAVSVPGTKETGLMVNPLRNLMWRLACPDGPNLKELFDHHSWSCMIHNITRDLLASVMEGCRNGKSYPQAVLQAVGLPDTKSGRRMIAGKPIYALAVMKLLAPTMLDEQGRKAVYDSMMNRWEKWMNDSVVSGWSANRVFPLEKSMAFFQTAIREIGQSRALPLITQLPTDELNDAAEQYEELTPAEQLTVWKNAGSAKKIHDTCTELHWRHKHPDYNLDVPEPIINRLMMQKESLKFYLPKTYHELHAAGEELRNCVGGGYPARMKEGKLCIVLVADDTGKLKVCIELQKDKIVQAKLFRNRPVYEDPVMLDKVMAWAKERKLKIATNDLIRPEKTEALPQAM